MKMKVNITSVLEPGDRGKIVSYDSSHPAASIAELGDWIEIVCKYPELLQVGAQKVLGDRSYEVMAVEGPLFEEKKTYLRRGEKFGATIRSRAQFAGKWLYVFTWHNELRKTILNEENLLALLIG